MQCKMRQCIVAIISFCVDSSKPGRYSHCWTHGGNLTDGNGTKHDTPLSWPNLLRGGHCMDLSILGLCSRGIEELGCVWHVQGCKLPNTRLALCWHYLPDSKKEQWVTVTPKVKKTGKKKGQKSKQKTLQNNAYEKKKTPK